MGFDTINLTTTIYKLPVFTNAYDYPYHSYLNSQFKDCSPFYQFNKTKNNEIIIITITITNKMLNWHLLCILTHHMTKCAIANI